MSETMAIMLAALGGELLLLLLGLLTVSFLRNRAARRRDHAAIQALLARVKRGKPEREQAIEEFLSSGLGVTGETLAQVKVGLLRAELVLLQRFAGIYQKREATAAGRFDGDLFAALAPYHALTAGGVVIEPGVEEDPDTAELEFLRKENARMAEELRITMETMSRMLNEYSAMFAGATPDNAAPIGAIAGAAGAVAEQGESGSEAHQASHAPAAQGESAPDLSAEMGVDDEAAADVVTAHAAEDPFAAPKQEPVQRDADRRDGPLEEGTVEVVTLDEPAEEGTAADDAGLADLFDAGDEPLKTRSAN